MARFAIVGILATASLLLHTVLARPLEIAVEIGKYHAWPSYPTDYPTPGPFTPSATMVPALTLPARIATGVWPTGISPPAFTPTGTAPCVSSATIPNKRQVEELAFKKRRAFEGPRHLRFPHYWPHYERTPGTADPWPTGTASGGLGPSITLWPSSVPLPTGTGVSSAWK